MKHATPHVFSAEFERKMEELMKVETPKMRAAKCKEKIIGYAQYAIAAVVTVLLLGGLIFSGNKKMTASQMKFCVTQWLENAFVIEEGDSKRQDQNILFGVNQIGYMPEGFELGVEENSFSRVYYKFQNDLNEYVILQIYYDSTNTWVDNQGILQECKLNEAGFEYRYIYKKESAEHIINWEDNNGICYLLYGTIDVAEIIKIMDGIIY